MIPEDQDTIDLTWYPDEDDCANCECCDAGGCTSGNDCHPDCPCRLGW